MSNAFRALSFLAIAACGTSLSQADKQVLQLQAENCADALKLLPDATPGQAKAEIATCVCGARGVLQHAHVATDGGLCK